MRNQAPIIQKAIATFGILPDFSRVPDEEANTLTAVFLEMTECKSSPENLGNTKGNRPNILRKWLIETILQKILIL